MSSSVDVGSGKARAAIASFKLRFVARHVRAVVAADASGCAFEGPGVDILGEDAHELFGLARPLLAWLEAREPLTLRTLGVDLRRRRILGTAERAGGRPRVIAFDDRTDPTSVAALLSLAEPLVRRIGELAAARIEARGRRDARDG